jgi:hypothetical protein
MRQRGLVELGVGVALMAIAVGTAEAQPKRVFVSATGSDANPCSRTQPCRTLDDGVATVAANGEVIVLDSGNYGDVVIGKAVSIVAAPGVYATIVQEGSQPGITVNAPAGALVILRNLTVHRQPAAFGGIGIRFNSGGQIYIEDCVVEGAFANGIQGGASGLTLHVTDTKVRGGIDEDAIEVFSGSAYLTRVHVDGTALKGLEAGGSGVKVTVRDSVFASTGQGILVGSGAVVTIENSQFSGHGTALNASTGGEFRVSQSVIANNGTGVGGAGTRISFENNRMVGNGADGTFSSTVALQ